MGLKIIGSDFTHIDLVIAVLQISNHINSGLIRLAPDHFVGQFWFVKGMICHSHIVI